jgi:hypothetical protein
MLTPENWDKWAKNSKNGRFPPFFKKYWDKYVPKRDTKQPCRAKRLPRKRKVE